MSKVENIFDKLDHFFASKKKNEMYLIFMMAASVIGFISYSYASPITESMLKKTTQLSKETEKKLKDEQAYLMSVSRDGDENYLINKVKNDIVNSKTSLENTTTHNAYIDQKLRELSYLLFNEQNWANFLNSITENSKKFNTNIKVIESKINTPNLQKIEQILTLKVDSTGSFANTMKFINSIEASELVVDIYDLNCTGKKNLEGHFEIAVWGMKY